MLQSLRFGQGRRCNGRAQKFHRNLFPPKGEQWMKDHLLYTAHKEWCWSYPHWPSRECIAQCMYTPSGHNRVDYNCCWHRLNHVPPSTHSFHMCTQLEQTLVPTRQCRQEHSQSQKKCFVLLAVSTKTQLSLCWLNCCFWLTEPWKQKERQVEAPPIKVLHNTLFTHIFFLRFHNKYRPKKSNPYSTTTLNIAVLHSKTAGFPPPPCFSLFLDHRARTMLCSERSISLMVRPLQISDTDLKLQPPLVRMIAAIATPVWTPLWDRSTFATSFSRPLD